MTTINHADAFVEDRELWQRAAEGDGSSFAVIFDRHSAAIHSYCARKTGSADDADDLVSIVFLEAWRRRSEVELHEDSALPWLYGVARNTILKRSRTAARHRAVLDRMPRVVDVPDHSDDVVDSIDQTRRAKIVADAFAQLKRREQDVLLLCVWQELDYAAAAVALSVPVGTVRSRLSRARTHLSELIAAQAATTAKGERHV